VYRPSLLLSQVRVLIQDVQTAGRLIRNSARRNLRRAAARMVPAKRLKGKRPLHRLSREERKAVEARLAQLGQKRLLIRSARPNVPTNRSQPEHFPQPHKERPRTLK